MEKLTSIMAALIVWTKSLCVEAETVKFTYSVNDALQSVCLRLIESNDKALELPAEELTKVIKKLVWKEMAFPRGVSKTGIESEVKTEKWDILLDTIEIPANRTRVLKKGSAYKILTDKQKNFLVLYLKGYKLKTIAEKMGISPRTVDNLKRETIAILKKTVNPEKESLSLKESFRVLSESVVQEETLLTSLDLSNLRYRVVEKTEKNIGPHCNLKSRKTFLGNSYDHTAKNDKEAKLNYDTCKFMNDWQLINKRSGCLTCNAYMPYELHVKHTLPITEKWEKIPIIYRNKRSGALNYDIHGYIENLFDQPVLKQDTKDYSTIQNGIYEIEKIGAKDIMYLMTI